TKKAADIYNLLGECYYNKESYKKSEEYFLKALSIQNTNTQVLCNLGVLNWMQGKNKEAVNFFQQALKINPDHKDSLANLVIVNYNEKNIASCINYAERFLEKYPNDEEICFYLQNSLAQVQNNEPGITKAL
ncbi:tetratricopeptide repeat protein, partial [Candidatus Desantisbacteria bacterium]|nr:tetratricopeptide repeat protein [Candidatus Desantisbacteria bacterium]